MPSKFTPERRKRILELVREGISQSAAARATGINEATVRGWRRKAEAGGPESRPYVAFIRKLDEARAQNESFLLGMVKAAAPKDWRAAAFLLERRFRDDYGRETRAKADLPEKVVDLKGRPKAKIELVKPKHKVEAEEAARAKAQGDDGETLH